MTIEAASLHKEYAAMSPRQRQVELSRLVLDGFPSFGLFDAIDEQPKDLPWDERFSNVLQQQNVQTDRRVQSPSEYREVLFDRLGSLLSFAPVTDTFRLVFKRELDGFYECGIPKPRSSQFSETLLERILLYPFGIPYIIKESIKSARAFAKEFAKKGPMVWIPKPESILYLVVESERDRVNHGGIFDKERAMRLEKQAYQSSLLDAALLPSNIFSEETGMRKFARVMNLRLAMLTGGLENIAQLSDRGFPFPMEVYRRWQHEFAQNYGKDLTTARKLVPGII